MGEGFPKVVWLEDEPLAEWSEFQGDRWTNVNGKHLYFSAGSILAYDPKDSPLFTTLWSNFTTIERRKATWRERARWWWQRRRRALALLVDPTLEDELEAEPW